MPRQTREPKTLKTALPYIFMIAGVIGSIASFVLTYDKIQLLQNPSYSPGCNLNPVLSCMSVMTTDQANLGGVPNSIFGLLAFTALTTFGFMLAAGAILKRWIWIAAQLVALCGVVFMHYLFFQAVYRIGAICPWCFVVWMITIPVFWYLTLYNLRAGHIRLASKYRKANGFLQQNHGSILAIWYAVILGILLVKFMYFWKTLI